MSRTVIYRRPQIRMVWLRDPDDRTFATQDDAVGSLVHLGIRWVEHHGA